MKPQGKHQEWSFIKVNQGKPYENMEMPNGKILQLDAWGNARELPGKVTRFTVGGSEFAVKDGNIILGESFRPSVWYKIKSFFNRLLYKKTKG